METNRHRPLPRAALLAAVVAAGSAGPLAAQDPGAPVSVLAPRAPQAQPSASPFSVLPDPVQSAGYRISPSTVMPGTTVAGSPQRMPAGEPAAGSPVWQAAPAGTGALGMPTAAPHQPALDTPYNRGGQTAGTPYPALTQPTTAPAWRWHGYGAVPPSENTQPISPGVTIPPRPAIPSNPAPSGSSVSPAPAAGPEVSMGTDWRQPGTVPTFTNAADAPPPLPAAVPAQPLSAAEPAWRAAGHQVVFAPANPMLTAPTAADLSAPRPASSQIVTVAAFIPEWRGRAVTLDAPRPAGTYISRGVSDAAVQPAVAVCIAPPVRPAATPPGTSLPIVRAAVQRACTGRGSDVELVPTGTGSLLVRLKVRQSADAEYLANAIARLPELGPYQVLFEMKVAR